MQGMRKTEVPHHSPEQIRGYFAEAAVIVDGLDLPHDMHAAFVLKVVDLLSAKQLFFEQVSPLGALAIPRNHQ